MNNTLKKFLLSSESSQTTYHHIGYLILRFFVGLALCTVFEKFLPREGIWGPQDWFIQDTANMGFPFPVFFAWIAVLAEFFGGILLMAGLFTRPAALLNVMVTFTATFIYHDGDIGNTGLTSFIFLVMCLCIVLFGPGRFSLDHLISKKLNKKVVSVAAALLLLLPIIQSNAMAAANLHSHQQIITIQTDTSEVKFSIKNQGIVPRKVTLIIYKPGIEGNNTRVRWFLPFQKVKMELPIGSRIYLASDEQIDIVMSGNSIIQDEPFLVVDESVRSTTVKLTW